MGKHIDFGEIEKINANDIKVDMLIETDLEGKIDNFKDFKSEAMTPLFEAIVNSIQAIEDCQPTNNGEIIVRIIREPYIQTKLNKQDGKGEQPKIINFEVEDNGIGFNEPNYHSFRLSDSTYKKKKGGKGLGRFSWLKAFNKIEIESVYSENGNKKKRYFEVTKKDWIQPTKNNITDALDKTQKTVVRLIGFKDKYRTHPSAYKTTEKIAQRILEHHLPYYIKKSAPSIIVKDGNQTIYLNQEYKKIESNIENKDIVVDGEQFTIHHVKLYQTHNDVHKIVFCANNRDVKSYKNTIKQIIGTNALQDADETFYYAAYVSGSFLDAHVDSGRTSFNIADNIDENESLDSDTISLAKIRDNVIEQTKIYLSKYIDDIKAQRSIVISDFVSKNPMLRAVPTYCPNILDEIDVKTPPEKINEVLYKNKGIAEWKMTKNMEELLDKNHIHNVQEIEEKCKKLSDQLSDFQKDDLAQYLLKRKVIIELFQRKLELNKDNGKYELESAIHDILFPRFTSTDQLQFEDHNLWMIDENLVYHHFAYSNEPIGETVPDIIVFRDVDDNSIAKSVSIIEIKRPQKPTLKDKSIVQQMFDIILEIQAKKIKCKGRDINITPSTKYNCFAICDINEQIARDAVGHTLTPFKDNLGYYGFNPNYNAYIEVLAYDKLLNDVKKRHQAFFDKLKIPAKIN